MKNFARTLSAVAVAVAGFAAGSANAQIYVGLNAGQTHLNIDCDNCSKEGTGIKALVGYQFTPYVAAELAYADTGKFKASGETLKQNGVQVGVAGTLPLTPAWEGQGRFGYTASTAKLSVNGAGSYEETSNGYYGGLGVNYLGLKNWKFGVGYDYSQMKLGGIGKGVDYLYLSTQYRF
jgi:hypothetical protein